MPTLILEHLFILQENFYMAIIKRVLQSKQISWEEVLWFFW